MEESIYNLIPREESAKGRQQAKTRYVSKYANQARKDAQAKKQSGSLMGPPGTKKPNPKSFLKKNTGDARQQSLAATRRTQSKSAAERSKSGQQTRKPRVPKASERPVMGVTAKKNYLKENAIKAVTQQAPANKTKRKDDLSFTQKKEYGKVPAYIAKRKEEEAIEHAQYEEYLRTVQMQDAPYQVPEDERQEILRGLKTNWQQLYHEYQGLSVVADTIPKKQRKTKMEAKLAQLEADIKQIERHTVIFVK